MSVEPVEDISEVSLTSYFYVWPGSKWFTLPQVHKLIRRFTYLFFSLESWRGLFFWGSLADSSVPIRPSSTFDYISNTISPPAAFSSVSQIKSNIFSKMFSQNRFAAAALLGDKTPKSIHLKTTKKSKAITDEKSNELNPTRLTFRCLSCSYNKVQQMFDLPGDFTPVAQFIWFTSNGETDVCSSAALIEQEKVTQIWVFSLSWILERTKTTNNKHELQWCHINTWGVKCSAHHGKSPKSTFI